MGMRGCKRNHEWVNLKISQESSAYRSLKSKTPALPITKSSLTAQVSFTHYD